MYESRDGASTWLYSRMEHNPRSSCRLKNLCNRCRRTSPSTKSTRFPINARVSPRFATTVVFPSPGPGLVITNKRGEFRSRPDRSEVTTARQDSNANTGERFAFELGFESDCQSPDDSALRGFTARPNCPTPRIEFTSCACCFID